MAYEGDNQIVPPSKPNYYLNWNMDDFINKNFSFNKREIIKFRQYWKSWPEIYNLDPAIQNAIFFHRQSFHYPFIINKYTNLIMAFESLYLKKSSRGELQYRLAHKAAIVIGRLGSTYLPDKVFSFIKYTYNLRSDHLHGEKIGNIEELNNFAIKDPSLNSTDIYDMWRKLEILLRISIQFFALNQSLLEKNNQSYDNPILFDKAIRDYYKNSSLIFD